MYSTLQIYSFLLKFCFYIYPLYSHKFQYIHLGHSLVIYTY